MSANFMLPQGHSPPEGVAPADYLLASLAPHNAGMLLSDFALTLPRAAHHLPKGLEGPLVGVIQMHSPGRSVAKGDLHTRELAKHR